MKSLRDYLEESDYAASNPVAGDTFAINIREECLIESVVVESRNDGVVIAADDRMIQLLESYGYTFEQTCMECGMPECGCGDPAAYSDDDEPDAGQNPGEYDQEGDMAKDELLTMIRSARKLIGMLDNNDNMPEWTQKKITKATDYVDTAADYVASKKERSIMSESLDHAYEVYGNRHGYYVWRKSPISQVLNIGITDPQLTGLTGWPVDQGILNYVKRSMQPVSFNSLSSGIKQLILKKLPLQSTNKQNVNDVPSDDNRYKLSGDEYWADTIAAIDKDQKLKQRLKTKPMSGPKGQLPEQSVAEGPEQQLSIQQLATISDEALDNAYQYGRSTPGNTFGWQANMKSAAYAKQMIDQGVTDIEAISDAIHKGWNTTAQAFVKNPEQFDDTAKLKAAGKLEAKLQQRAQLMKQNYAQLPEEEKEKDRVVARALLKALRGSQGMAEGSREPNPVARAILHRIMMQHPGMLAQYGPDQVMNAVDDVADYIGDVEEIGTSDVSGYVRQVQQMLSGLREQGVAEGADDLRSAVLSVIQDIYNGAQAGEDMIDNVADELGDFFNDVKRSKDRTLRNAYQLMRQQGGEAEDDPQMMAQVAKQAIDMLSQQGMAEGSRKAWMKHNNLVDLDPALKGLEDEMEKFIRLDPEERRKYQQGIKQRIKSDPMAGPKGVLPEQGMTEDLQADDGERYRSADDFFGQFEADHFDEERVSPDGMEVRGYIDGVNVMVWRFDNPRKTSGYGIYDDSGLNEAEYQGRKVQLGKKMKGDVKKSKVYVKNPQGNVVKVNFGDPNMKIRKSNPGARKSFRARHNCDNPGPRHKARYWSCRAW